MRSLENLRHLDVLLLAWLGVVTFCVSTAWGFSFAGLPLVWTGWVVLFFCGGSAYFLRATLASAIALEWKVLKRERLGLLLFFLIVLSSLLYLPAVQDSLAYRIPRIRFWLQDGGLTWISGGDYRMNTMGRNWEWLGLGVLSLGLSDRFLTLPSVLSWFFLWRILRSWSSEFVSDSKISKCLLIVLICSPVFVLQASSTMNDLLGAALVGTSVFLLIRAWCLRGQDSGVLLVASGMALAIASGVKPNYATMCPFWLLGSVVWLFKRQGQLPWRHLVWAIPVAVVGSCLPTLWFNIQETGHLTGTGANSSYAVEPSTPMGGFVWGSVMFWFRSIQPALNPFAGLIGDIVAPLEKEVSADIPRFSLVSSVFANGSGANLGFFSTLVVLCGGGLALVRNLMRKSRDSRLFICMFFVGLVAMGINFAVAVPNASPRSSIGFVIPMIPLALCGLNFNYGKGTYIFGQGFALGAASLAFLLILIEPYRPLLGSKGSAFIITKVFRQDSPKVKDTILRFRERVYAGREIFGEVPEGEVEVAVCFEHGTNLTEAWRSLDGQPRVGAFTPSEFVRGEGLSNVNFLVVAPLKADELHAESQFSLAIEAWTEVKRVPYLQQISKGEQDWVLYRRK